MKDIKDYLHLYLGCEVEYLKTFKGVLLGVEGDHIYLGIDEQDGRHRRVCFVESIKPILRPLSDMTDEEREQLNDIELGESSWPTVARALAPCFAWMLSKGFDLFGLIESGLAIDKTKISQPA